MIKNFINFKIFFIYLFLCLESFAIDSANKNDLIVIGSDKAEIKIQVFSSLTCPHCANFHTDVLPKIKKNYIESGKVQIILIDFPLDQAAFNASKLVNCTEHKKQIKFLDILYENQNIWIKGSDIKEINNNLQPYIVQCFEIFKKNVEE